MLEARNIHKSYKDLRVLKNVDISIAEAEIISIVGKSGSGKTTLLHILGTLDKADSGTLTIGGNRIDSLGPKELAKFRNKEIGFIFQFHYLLAEFTALENVCLPGFVERGHDRRKVEKKAKELLNYLGLSDRETHKPSQLSGGEQQRVAVARALINDPKMVFADEPSGNLDNASSDELHQLFFQLRKDFKQAFVIVTHNTELADMSDRCLSLLDGVLNE